MNLIELSVGGKKATGALNVLAFRKYCEANRIDLGSLFEHLQLSAPFGWMDLFYYAHEAQSELTGARKVVSHLDCTMAVEEIEPSELSKISEAALNVKVFGKSLADHAAAREDDAKKKKVP